MKKFIVMLIAAFISFGVTTTASAQTKALLKDVKKTVKQKKKEKWEMLTATSTMDYAFAKYRTYMEEDEDNRIALDGIAIGKNPKIGRDNAVNNAITNYAIRVAANVKGKVKSIASSDASAQEEIDKFGQAFESSVNTKIAGLVKQHFVLRRPMANGQYEYNAFLSIDRKAIAEAAKLAAKEALDAFKLQSLSDQVADFIGDAVDQAAE